MALKFEYENIISTYSNPFISYNTKSDISHYSIDNSLEFDSTGQSLLGEYSNVVFSNEGHNITNKTVTRIGGKNIPGIGTIAFYKDAITGDCYIVNVLNYLSPILKTVEMNNDNNLHVVINCPDGAYYDCYRIVLQQNEFAHEFITHHFDTIIDIPLVKGDYSVYCFGYDEFNGVISPISNSLDLTVESGLDDWRPITVSENELLINRIKEMENSIKELNKELEGVGDKIDTLNGEVI